MNTCTNCEKEFEGRRNQKFCGQKCKNHYHNERNREREGLVIQLNKMLHKNWTILNQMYEAYKSKPIDVELLEANGFETKYHTHTHNSPVGEKYHMIYDFGWKNYYDNQVQIVRNDNI